MGERAVIYARVSTREQAVSGFSIESQTKLLKDYARNHELEIVREFTDIESAKASGRPQFMEMQRYLKANRSVKTILCEKTDRLYRNFHDYIDLDVDQGDLTVILVKENTILNKESRSHEKLCHGFKVLLAKNYIDNLREETSKGMLEKAEQGEFPDLAPLGYRNNKETHRVDVDRERAPLIRRMFELYATGQHSLMSLAHKIAEEGLRSRKGRTISKSQIAFMLGNPMYYGSFRFRGKLYQGIHEPLITQGLFETVQKVLKRWDKPRKCPREFAFRGFLTCGKCGCSFTAEAKKQRRYVYYHCTYARGKCSNKYVREDWLDNKIGELLKALQMSPEVMETAKTGLLESHRHEKAYHDQAVAALHKDYQRLQDKLDQAYNDKLEGKITTEFWEKQAATWRREQEENRAAVARHENANQKYFDMGVAILELASQAYENYRVRSLSEKRRLASALLSNLTITGENVVPTYKEPFGLLAEGLSRPNWLRSIYTYQGSRELTPPVVIWHETRFGVVLAAKGRQEIVDLNAFREHQAVLAKRVRKLHPPHIQTVLKRAHELAARLAAAPALTREALAKEAGLHPGHLTRLLRLSDLAPEIQRHILALPPCHGWGPISERALRPIARCQDREDQVRWFNELLKAKEGSNETIGA